jgi:hypothetical protein
MQRREEMFGIAEKIPKNQPPQAARRKVVALEAARAHKRR